LNTKILPACPQLERSIPEPLNKTAPSNLYKAQKLLLLESGSNMEMPPHLVGVAIKDDHRDRVDDWLGDLMGNEAGFMDDGDLPNDHQLSFWSFLGIFLLICSGCYLTYRYCRHKRRQLRARIMPARKRLSQVLANKTIASPTPNHAAATGNNSNVVKNNV
jgi:hypothetical protein